MSNESNEIPVGATDAVLAERYLAEELKKAKQGLLYTQIGMVAAVVIVGGYLGSITNTFKANLEPKAFADTVKTLVATKVEEGAPEIQDYVRKEVPAAVAKLPDVAKENLPKFREQIEERLTAQIDGFVTATADQLGQSVDTFLTNNKESVEKLIQDGQSPEATKEITSSMKSLFVKYLETDKDANGESLKDKLDQSLEALNTIDLRMKKLAANKGLTPSEKSARKAIAVLMRTVDASEIEPANLPNLTKQ